MTEKVHLFSRSQCSDPSEFACHFAQVQEDLRAPPYRKGLPGLELGSQFVEVPLTTQREFWILEEKNGRSLGRISANRSPLDDQVGYIGFFEADQFSSAKRLIETAFEWLQAQGVNRVYGPINFNTWLSYRFRIDEDHSASYSFEPINPPEYPNWFQKLGFKICETYHSLGIDGNEAVLEKSFKDYQNALSRGYSFRIADRTDRIDSELKKIYEISLESFQDAFLFEVISFEAFRKLYVPTVQKLPSNTVHFLCDPRGEEIGYFSTFLEAGATILKTLALTPKARGLRLSNALFHQAVLDGAKKGSHSPVPALIRDGIQSESYSQSETPLWKHRYALFEKNLLGRGL